MIINYTGERTDPDVAERVADQVVPAFGPQGLVLMTTQEGRLNNQSTNTEPRPVDARVQPLGA